MNYTVYKHTNLFNGKIYIGITSKKVNQRWKNGAGYKTQPYFYNAILKYTWDGFSHEILYTNLSEEEAKQKEIDLISKYKSNNKKYGYNITGGGDGLNGYKFSKEHSKNMSNAMKGKNAKQIYQYSLDGHFIKIWDSIVEASESLGINFRSIADCCRGEHYSAGNYMWKFANEDIGNKITPYSELVHDKYIIQMDMNGKYIKKWNSANDIQKQLHIRRNNISSVCTGKRKSAGGYMWKYA